MRNSLCSWPFVGLGAIVFSAGISAGCGESDRDDIGGEVEFDDCVADRQSLSFDEDSELGFSADDVFASVVTSGQVGVEWSDPQLAAASLEWELQPASTTAYFVTMLSEDGATSSACDGPYLELSADLQVNTDDGKLDEVWMVEIRAASADVASVMHFVSVDEISGSLSLENGNQRQLVLEGAFGTASFTGQLFLAEQVQGEDSLTDKAWELVGEW